MGIGSMLGKAGKAAFPFVSRAFTEYTEYNRIDVLSIDDEMKEKIQHAIQVCFNMENYEITINQFFKSVGDSQKFADYLIERSRETLTSYTRGHVDENDTEFEQVIRKWVQHIYDEEYYRWSKELVKGLTPGQKDTFAANRDAYILAATRRNTSMQEKTEECIKDDISTPTSQAITDSNSQYEEAYKQSLFMENELNGNNVTLSDIYVHPKVESKNAALDDILKSWCTNTNPNEKVCLLYGKAGIGKTSFVSHVIAEHMFSGYQIHAIPLRSQKYREMLKNANAWESVKKCFGCDNDAIYKDKCILILDGLDELHVLEQEFNATNFVESLKRGPSGIKILITTRDGYFDEPYGVKKLHITWTEQELKEWCTKYTKEHPEKRAWADNFIKAYEKLPRNEENDKRHEIFCTPIILYICCVRGICV